MPGRRHALRRISGIIVKLTIYTALMVALKHIPAIFRILNGKEERLSFKEDLTYKLDQPF